MIDDPCDHKQKIGKAVQIFNDASAYFYFLRKLHHAAFSPATYSTRDMQQGAGMPSAGQNELTQRWQFRFETIDRFLQNRRALGSKLKLSARPLPEFRIRELGAHRKQILLNIGKNGRQLGVRDK